MTSCGLSIGSSPMSNCNTFLFVSLFQFNYRFRHSYEWNYFSNRFKHMRPLLAFNLSINLVKTLLFGRPSSSVRSNFKSIHYWYFYKFKNIESVSRNLTSSSVLCRFQPPSSNSSSIFQDKIFKIHRKMFSIRLLKQKYLLTLETKCQKWQ